MEVFQQLSGFHIVANAIDKTDIHIWRPYVGPKDYFYFKSSGYSIQVYAIVDRNKRFLDVAIDMPRNILDSSILCLSSLYQQVENRSLFNPMISFNGFFSFFIWNATYPF
jgi:hypothetical protein